MLEAKSVQDVQDKAQTREEVDNGSKRLASFGFRHEHINGPIALKEWLSKPGEEG